MFTKFDTRAISPFRATEGSAGHDVFALLGVNIPAGEQRIVHTGIGVIPSPGHYIRIAGRSGLAMRDGITVGGGVVDNDYRGELKVILFNHGKKPFVVERGDRIAQMIQERYCDDEMKEVDIASFVADTGSRGVNGFGSSGR